MLRRLVILGLVVLWSGVAQAAEVTCSVKYLSAEHVYLDAGSGLGLTVGLTGRVVRAGEAIGEVAIVFVAGNSSSCTVNRSVVMN